MRHGLSINWANKVLPPIFANMGKPTKFGNRIVAETRYAGKGSASCAWPSANRWVILGLS